MATEEDPMERMERQTQARIMRLTGLGDALGLHKTFIQDVVARDQEAIVDRVASTDETGAYSRLLALTQIVGQHLERRIERGIVPDGEELLDVVADMAPRFDIEPIEAVQLVGPVLEVYQQAARLLSRKGSDETDTVGTVNASPA